MKEILLGTKHTSYMTVKEQDLATKWGSSKAKVYATPAMIAFMELTATECVDQFLEPGEITVGTMVNVRHLKASPIGSVVKCECKIIEVAGKAITLNVSCYVNDELIGTGTHERYVVNKQKFEENTGGIKMAKLTQEMKDMFAVQLPIVATVNEDGTPNLGPKRSARLLDDETIIFNENTSGKTQQNIERTGDITVMIVDREKLDGYRFVGKASVYTSGEYYDGAVKWAEGRMGVPKAAIVMKVEKIYTLKSGPTAGTEIK